MPAIALNAAAWKTMIEALLRSPPGAVLVSGVAVTALVQAVRSAWWDIYGRWYGP